MDCKCNNFTSPSDYCVCQRKRNYTISTINKEKKRLIKLLILTLLSELETEDGNEHSICELCKHKESNHTDHHHHEQKHYEDSSSSSLSYQEKSNPFSKKTHKTFEASDTSIMNDINLMKLLEQFDMNNLSQITGLIKLMSTDGNLNPKINHQISAQEENLESSSSSYHNNVDSSSCDEVLNQQEDSRPVENPEPHHSIEHKLDKEDPSFEEKKTREKKTNYASRLQQGKKRAKKRRKFD